MPHIEFFQNACCLFQGNEGSGILCDPWFNDGAFIGSWALPQKPHRTPIYGIDFDCIYVSHIHPDHYDLEFLCHQPKDIPIIIPHEKIPILYRALLTNKFSNVIRLKDRENLNINGFKLTMYLPFESPRFDKEILDTENVIDSAIAIQNGNFTMLNTNDNFPTKESLLALQKELGKISLITILYNSAGFYPQCDQDLTHEEKISLKSSLISNCIKSMLDVLSSVDEETIIVPFAGDYILQGKNSSLNKYLPVSTPTIAAEILVKNKYNAINPGSGGIFDAKTLAMSRQGRCYSIEEAFKRGNDLTNVKYPYECRDFPSLIDLRSKAKKAEARLIQRLQNIGWYDKSSILDWEVDFYSNDDKFIYKLVINHESKPKFVLKVQLDTRLMEGILNREFHWDNAQTGCHLKFSRSCHPKWSPDLHCAMSFFHL
ncbi:MBL fold metallo-hydrolase [Synechococcus sp. UW105]|uniref:MBL fold metallo-hydrolase n=1 Tax=Synechococcus sp. UW105 TaxID=337067 RepID=UPI000E0FE2FD|nr:MBL fold metallo-hydrolase [Synechococcus sp. UW105]